MKRRILSLLGLIGLAIVAYWIWNNLAGGQGLMRNVVRYTIIGALVPWALYLDLGLAGRRFKEIALARI